MGYKLLSSVKSQYYHPHLSKSTSMYIKYISPKYVHSNKHLFFKRRKQMQVLTFYIASLHSLYDLINIWLSYVE